MGPGAGPRAPARLRRLPHPDAASALDARGLGLAPFGTASDRILVLASLFGLLAFYVVVYLLTQRLLGRLIALIAVAVMVTRTDMQLLALRAMFDLPFYLMIFGAALLELRRPRCGWPVLALLALAGLLRPEAWLLAGVYWLYLIPVTPRPRLVWYALLVAAAPVLWMASDLIVTGEPLYSLTSTREVSGQFGRNRGLFEAITLIPQYSGGNDRIVTVGVGGLGLLLGVYILRRRAALPLALGGARAGDVPDHRGGRALGDPPLPDDPVAAALALRRDRGRGLDAGRRADAAAGGDRDRDRLRARARLARPFYYRDYAKLADQATSSRPSTRG